MRFLIGAACVAVIAFVGYFLWGEYSHSLARAQSAQAKLRTDFENGCWRLIRTRPEYESNYAENMGPAEKINRLKKCETFFETGKLP